MGFFDELRKNINNLSKASEEVVKKSGGAVELRRLKMEQESLRSELNSCYAQIGRLVVEKPEGEDVSDEMELLVKQIADCKEALAENERLIAKKKGLRLCPVCGAKADKEAVYCQKCGSRLPEEEADKEPEPAREAGEQEAEEAADAVREDTGKAEQDVKEAAEKMTDAAEEAAEKVTDAAEEAAEKVTDAAGEAQEEIRAAREDAQV